jgi:hypothetical protein
MVMRDESGKATDKKHVLREDDDPRVIAGVLCREAWSKAMGEGNFNRPLYYPQQGWI